MSSINLAFFPDDGEPKAYLNGEIPVVLLGGYPHDVALQFQPSETASTLRYLNQLELAVRSLSQKIVQHEYSQHLTELEKADTAERQSAKSCPVCGSTDPAVFKLQPQGPPCTDAEGWHLNAPKAVSA